MEMIHEPSGCLLATDPPKDNGGEGRSYSPTDLVATALASCMMSVMAIAAKKDGLDLTGMASEVEKHMSADLPRRIVRLDVMIRMPDRLTSRERQKLEEIGNHCPVIQSLHPAIQVNTSYRYV